MPPERVTAALRRVVAARAQDYCEYCRSPAQFATQSFTVEHIQPRNAGGATTLDNLAWACFGCNSHKYSKTHAIDPETSKQIALFHPRQQSWADHFAWRDDFSLIVGRTPCGRATIESLQLNRPGLVNLRRVLVVAGVHPPATR
ncbi:MAG: HNH endonuclease [Chloroflexota bacterium]